MYICMFVDLHWSLQGSTSIGLANQNFLMIWTLKSQHHDSLARGLFLPLEVLLAKCHGWYQTTLYRPPMCYHMFGSCSYFQHCIDHPKTSGPLASLNPMGPKTQTLGSFHFSLTHQSSWLHENLLQVPGRWWHQVWPRKNVCRCCRYINYHCTCVTPQLHIKLYNAFDTLTYWMC